MDFGNPFRATNEPRTDRIQEGFTRVVADEFETAPGAPILVESNDVYPALLTFLGQTIAMDSRSASPEWVEQFAARTHEMIVAMVPQIRVAAAAIRDRDAKK